MKKKLVILTLAFLQSANLFSDSVMFINMPRNSVCYASEKLDGWGVQKKGVDNEPIVITTENEIGHVSCIQTNRRGKFPSNKQAGQLLSLTKEDAVAPGIFIVRYINRTTLEPVK